MSEHEHEHEHEHVSESEHAQRSSPIPPLAQRKQAGKQAGDRKLPAMARGRASHGSPTHDTAGDHPAGDNQADIADAGRSVMAVDVREMVWTLHLRGVSKRQIAAQVGIHRDTVAKLINECYREFGAERRARLRRKLDAVVARLEQVQEQAWNDHDVDDARERWALEEAPVGTRYTSQRASYLRIALDAQKEIARLEGLYSDDASDVLGILFRIERTEQRRQTERQSEQQVVEAMQRGGGNTANNDNDNAADNTAHDDD